MVSMTIRFWPQLSPLAAQPGSSLRMSCPLSCTELYAQPNTLIPLLITFLLIEITSCAHLPDELLLIHNESAEYQLFCEAFLTLPRHKNLFFEFLHYLHVYLSLLSHHSDIFFNVFFSFVFQNFWQAETRSTCLFIPRI